MDNFLTGFSINRNMTTGFWINNSMKDIVVPLKGAQDHKRALDGDKGENTGGMGAYAPAPVVSESVMHRVKREIIEPMHHHLRNQETPYRGCLYVGLMIDQEGSPGVIEFNVRFGDPETQVTIPLISSDLGQLLLATAELCWLLCLQPG